MNHADSPLAPNAKNVPKTAPQGTVSPENRRFNELVENGKFGTILKDPATGDVAVVFAEGLTAKLTREETFTSTPEYGSEPNPGDDRSFVAPSGKPFHPRIEQRPMTNAEILSVAKAKIEKAKRGEPLAARIPKLLSEFGVALEENGKHFRLSDSKGGAHLDFEIQGKTTLERQKKAAQLHYLVGRAIETMRACEAKNPLLAECRAYSDIDPIVSYGYRELKIDDKLFGDTVIASGEELAGLTKGERRNFAEKLAPFVNSIFKSRYESIVKKNAPAYAPLAMDDR